MEKPLNVLITTPVFSEENWPGEEKVNLFFAFEDDAIIELLPEMDVFITIVRFTKAMGAVAKRLKLIQCLATGIDRVDLDAVPDGCLVANAYGHEKPMAEWTVMMMLALNRELIRGDQSMRRGSWELSPRHGHRFPELGGQTLGILGLGQIGKGVAPLAKVFGMRLIAATRTVPSQEEKEALGFEEIYPFDQRDRVIETADFLLISVPLNDATRGLIGERELALMPRHACIINVARAEVIQEKPLYEALKGGEIGGAALDVWYKEPTPADPSPQPATCPFWELENVIMAPHNSAMSDKIIERKVLFIGENIDRLARGETPQNIVFS